MSSRQLTFNADGSISAIAYSRVALWADLDGVVPKLGESIFISDLGLVVCGDGESAVADLDAAEFPITVGPISMSGNPDDPTVLATLTNAIPTAGSFWTTVELFFQNSNDGSGGYKKFILTGDPDNGLYSASTTAVITSGDTGSLNSAATFSKSGRNIIVTLTHINGEDSASVTVRWSSRYENVS